MKRSKYYKDLNLIRLISCIAVLLYHFNILKGGYLAVCVFFVLSGYLSCISAFKKDKFNLLDYYKNKIKKLYLPLLIVVFITIFVISLSNNLWLSLKPETTSVLFGYNNFYQINANADYFASHIESPFIHFWYIAILLQFDLIFPFVYLIFKKLGDKTNEMIPCNISIILSVLFSIYFYKMSIDSNITIIYYDTSCRLFSLLFGFTLGLIHSYYKNLTFKFKTSTNRIIFYSYLFILILLFIMIGSDSKFFAPAMILTSLISCRLIDYGTISYNNKNNFSSKIINFFSNLSYEIYLVQYPVIYLFQNININNYLKIIIMTICIFLVSYIINFSLNIKKNKIKVLKTYTLAIILGISLAGFYEYIIAKDHTNEMKQLENQLAENGKILEQKQNEYEIQFKQNQEKWASMINNLETMEKELPNVISNLSIVGIGDSIMLGTIKNLYDQFPNGYFDAEISRTAWVVNGILEQLENKDMLGEPILLNLGTNGDCPYEEKIKIMKNVGNKKVFWINVSNDKSVRVNDELNKLANTYKNLHIIDWETISKDHPEYFVSDKIHLSETGKKVYTKAIYDSIYKVYLDELLLKKEEMTNQYEQESKNKITFYGNDILLNIFEQLQKEFSNSKFIINKFDFISLKNQIQNEINNNTLTNKIVFGFDQNTNLSEHEYQELINLCSDKQIYILSTKENINSQLSNLNNVTIINFYDEIKNNHYLMPDQIHLTYEGNIALFNILKNNLN